MILLGLFACFIGVDSLKLLSRPPETIWVREGDSVKLNCTSDIPWNYCSFNSSKAIQVEATSGKSPESDIPSIKFKNSKLSCVLEINDAEFEKHDGRWMYHVADSRENELHKEESIIHVKVATKFSPKIKFRNPETLSSINLNNQLHLNTPFSIECSGKEEKTPIKPSPNLKLFIKTKDGMKRELGASSLGNQVVFVNYTLEKTDADSQFLCESIQIQPDQGSDVQGEKILFHEEEKSPKIDLIYKPIFEPYKSYYIYKDNPVEIEVNFSSRPPPKYVVWLDQNDVEFELGKPSHSGHYININNVNQGDFYEAQIMLNNLTEDTMVKLRVINEVDQVEAVIEVKVESTHPESIPAIDSASIGQIPLWVIILVIITILLIIGLLGFGICKIKKNKETKTTEDKLVNVEIQDNKLDEEKEPLQRDEQKDEELIVETQKNYLQGNPYDVDNIKEKTNEDLDPASFDETDKVEQKKDIEDLSSSPDNDSLFNENVLNVQEDTNFRKSLEEMTLMPDVVIVETSTAKRIKATNSLPRAPTRHRSPMSPTSNIMTSGPTNYPIFLPREDRVFFGPNSTLPGRKTPQLDLLSPSDTPLRNVKVLVNDTDL